MNRCAVLRLDNVQATYARRRRDADWVRSFISPLILLLKHILRTRAMQVALGEIFTGVFSVSVAPPPPFYESLTVFFICSSSLRPLHLLFV